MYSAHTASIMELKETNAQAGTITRPGLTRKGPPSPRAMNMTGQASTKKV